MGHLPPLAKPDKYEFLSDDLKSVVRLTERYSEVVLEPHVGKLPQREGSGKANEKADKIRPSSIASAFKRKVTSNVVEILEDPFTDDFNPADYQFDEESHSVYEEEEETRHDEDECMISGYLCNCPACRTPKVPKPSSGAPADDSSDDARRAPVAPAKKGAQRFIRERELENAPAKKKTEDRQTSRSDRTINCI